MSTPSHGVLVRLLTGFVFIGSLCVFATLLGGNLPAQQAQNKKPPVVEEEDDKKPKKKPPVEEEEDSGQKQKKKVIRVDDDDAPKTPSRSTGGGGAFSGDLTSLKDRTKNSGLRELCRKLFKAHDVIYAEFTTRKEKMSVAPLAKDYGREPKLERDLPVTPFGQEWELEKTRNLAAHAVKKYTPYEELAQTEVENFLNNKSCDAHPTTTTANISKP